MFADSAKILIRSGKGGDGHVSFRRELYVAAGGPDGGDGGKGGDIIFEVDKGLNTLTDFRHVRKYQAESGEEGGKQNRHGRSGEDLIIKVPEGTVIREAESGKVIADMSGQNLREIVLKGGRGGKGNRHYATATMQVPKYAQPGQDAKELWVELELKVIADVGLLGYPNVGKSTFLSRVSNAKPKIANYHFTTIQPNLGVVDLPDQKGFVIADIPGLIEGAAQGIGLGHSFLRHLERTKLLIHLLDAASTEGRDPLEDFRAINHELKAYSGRLASLPQIVAANKMDIMTEEEGEIAVQLIRDELEPEGYEVYPVSAATGAGVRELLYAVRRHLDQADDTPVVFEREFFPEAQTDIPEEPYTVDKVEEGVYSLEGPRIERMLGYTNLDSEKGFIFFQNFLKDGGILSKLEALGIQDGDTVKIYGHEFLYYK